MELTSRSGKLFSDLKLVVNVAGAMPLRANAGISSPGVKLHGSGFIVTPEQAEQLGLGRIPGLEQHIREYRNGRDLTQTPRGVRVIDLYGLTADQVRQKYPEVYQWVYERVKPERDHNNRAIYRDNWWIFGEPRKDLRPALDGLPRYIATVETSRHRFFVFLDEVTLPDNKLIAITLDDAYPLGILSSRVHIAWSLASGSRLGVGNDPVYVKTRCFETFPFPPLTPGPSPGRRGEKEELLARIRDLAEQIDAHRKRQQALHRDLTLTGMYNVLEKLRRLTATSNPPSPPERGAGGEGKNPQLPKHILERARKLRQEQTDAETLLWRLLRDRQLGGYKFRRQHPLPPYVLDFYCHEKRLAVELDGGQHMERRQQDDRRTEALERQGIRVVRFWNHEVLGETEAVVEAIWQALETTALTPTPLPGGEGLRTVAAELSAKERQIHEQGLVSVLGQLHDELDAAVLAAYGWSDLAPALVGKPGGTTPLTDRSTQQAEAEEELLRRLVALNAKRAGEEARGLVRWLRPEYQNPGGESTAQVTLDTETGAVTTVTTQSKRPWPKDLAHQAQAVRAALAAGAVPMDARGVARSFQRANTQRVAALLDTLVSLGQAREVDPGMYVSL